MAMHHIGLGFFASSSGGILLTNGIGHFQLCERAGRR